jgi:hypothetical protein
VSAGKPLRVAPPSFRDRPAEQTRAALLALRALYRDHLDQRRLDSNGGTSVDRRSSDEKERS